MPAQRRLICHINHTQCVQRKATRGKTHLNVASASAAHNSNAADGQNDEAQSEQLLLLVLLLLLPQQVQFQLKIANWIQIKRNALYAMFN